MILARCINQKCTPGKWKGYARLGVTLQTYKMPFYRAIYARSTSDDDWRRKMVQ